MKIYNFYGYSIIFIYSIICMYVAPLHIGPWLGLLVSTIYLLVMWFSAGLYLSDIIHLGISHRSLDYKEWFIKTVTVVNNTFGIYINPITWVNRHRLHHKFADQAGDPNKLASDGFWRTLYLCLMPYKCNDNLATDTILKSTSFKIVSSLPFALISQAFNFWLLWYMFGSLAFAASLWIGVRVFAVLELV